MHVVKGVLRIVCLLSVVLFINPASAERTILVIFSTATLTVLEDTGQPLFHSPVVLPKKNFYPVPATGKVRRAEMGPGWKPTANMHRDFPGRYKETYRPYESGNAMGHCKVSIDFDQKHPLLHVVRIHGNGKAEDLGKRRSRSCIRVPDALCQTLTSAINSYDGPVRVQFKE